MLVDLQFFSNFYFHWFFSNLTFFERDPHMDSPEGIRGNNIFMSVALINAFQTKPISGNSCLVKALSPFLSRVRTG